MLHTNTGENIVDFPLRRGANRTDAFCELETYWQSLCAGRIMPFRDELDPRGLSGALPWVFLIERIAPGTARFRVAGQDLTDMLGMDLRGMPVSCVVRPGGRQRLADTLKALFDEPARIELTLDGGAGLLRGRTEGRLVCLPLRDRDGTVRRAVGCLAVAGAPARAPQSFDIVGELRRTLIGYGEVSAAAPALSFATADAAREVVRRKSVQRAHLTLVSR